MARRYAMNPDFLQSVPPKARAQAREETPNATPAKPVKARTTARKHAARVLGAATLASVLSIALFASPGENPALNPQASAPQKILAQGLNNVHNPVHSSTQPNRNKRNDRKQRTRLD